MKKIESQTSRRLNHFTKMLTHKDKRGHQFDGLLDFFAKNNVPTDSGKKDRPSKFKIAATDTGQTPRSDVQAGDVGYRSLTAAKVSALLDRASKAAGDIRMPAGNGLGKNRKWNQQLDRVEMQIGIDNIGDMIRFNQKKEIDVNEDIGSDPVQIKFDNIGKNEFKSVDANLSKTDQLETDQIKSVIGFQRLAKAEYSPIELTNQISDEKTSAFTKYMVRADRYSKTMEQRIDDSLKNKFSDKLESTRQKLAKIMKSSKREELGFPNIFRDQLTESEAKQLISIKKVPTLDQSSGFPTSRSYNTPASRNKEKINIKNIGPLYQIVEDAFKENDKIFEKLSSRYSREKSPYYLGKISSVLLAKRQFKSKLGKSSDDVSSLANTSATPNPKFVRSGSYAIGQLSINPDNLTAISKDWLQRPSIPANDTLDLPTGHISLTIRPKVITAKRTSRSRFTTKASQESVGDKSVKSRHAANIRMIDGHNADMQAFNNIRR